MLLLEKIRLAVMGFLALAAVTMGVAWGFRYLLARSQAVKARKALESCLQKQTHLQEQTAQERKFLQTASPEALDRYADRLFP